MSKRFLHVFPNEYTVLPITGATINTATNRANKVVLDTGVRSNGLEPGARHSPYTYTNGRGRRNVTYLCACARASEPATVTSTPLTCVCPVALLLSVSRYSPCS
jgi:hypothetical protein